MAKAIVNEQGKLQGRDFKKIGETTISAGIIYLLIWLAEKYIFKGSLEEEAKAAISLVVGELIRRWFFEPPKVIEVTGSNTEAIKKAREINN